MEQFTLWLPTNRRKMYLTFSIDYASDKSTQHFFLSKGCGILSENAGTCLIPKHADTESGALVIPSFTKTLELFHRLWNCFIAISFVKNTQTKIKLTL